MLLYFLHRNNPEKTQYNINEIQGELKEYLAEKLCGQEPSEEKLKFITEQIKNNNIKNEYQLIMQCIEIKGLEILHKFGYILIKMLKKT